MPAVRVSRRRRSSLAYAVIPAKAGIYGVPTLPVVTFAPNVTQETYTLSDNDEDDYTLDPSLLASTSASASTSSRPNTPSQVAANGKIIPQAKLFPPSATPAPPPTRKRCPPGKRRSLGYIPRPPNAFMLFRADFVRQKHVPGSIETNHGSLSKIIGTCWRKLPLEEKKVWEVKAKHAKAEHKAMYPEYKFKPVHNRNKNANGMKSSNPSSRVVSSSHPSESSSSDKKGKPLPTVEDERRCEQVAQLLLEGKKGEELAQAVRAMDHLAQVEKEAFAVEARAEAQARADVEASMQVQVDAIVAAEAAEAYAKRAGLYQPMPVKFQHLQMQHPSLIGHRRSSSVPLPDYWPPMQAHGQGEWQYDSQQQDWANWQQQAGDYQLFQQPYHHQEIAAPTPSSSIALPTLLTRPLTPLAGGDASRRQSRLYIGLAQRRASSAQPLLQYQYQLGRRVYSKDFCSGSGSFTEFPTSSDLSSATAGGEPEMDMELPDVDTSLFNQTFLQEGFGSSTTPPATQVSYQRHSPSAEEAYGAGTMSMSDLFVPPLQFGGYQMSYAGAPGSAATPAGGYEMGPVDPLTTPPHSLSPTTPASTITCVVTPPPAHLNISLDGVSWASSTTGFEGDDHDVIDADAESLGSSTASEASSSTSSDHGSPKMIQHMNMQEYQTNVHGQQQQHQVMDMPYGTMDSYPPPSYAMNGMGVVDFALGLDMGAVAECQTPASMTSAAPTPQDMGYGYDASAYGYSIHQHQFQHQHQQRYDEYGRLIV